MMTLETLVNFFSQKSIISMVSPALLILPFIALAGCTNDGAGGPTISSLSTSTDASADLDSDQAPHSEATDSDGEEDPIITMTSTPTGVTAHMTWDHPSDYTNGAGYKIYYRKQPAEEQTEEQTSEESSSEEPGACSYEERQTVEAPPATITGLEPNTQYLFAISTFNTSGSLCSNEITVVTPPAHS